jgi:hypothetical protein
MWMAAHLVNRNRISRHFDGVGQTPMENQEFVRQKLQQCADIIFLSA